jgi:hypothetical protein
MKSREFMQPARARVLQAALGMCLLLGGWASATLWGLLMTMGGIVLVVTAAGNAADPATGLSLARDRRRVDADVETGG